MWRTIEAHHDRQAQRRQVLLEGAIQSRSQLKSQFGPHQIDHVATQRSSRRQNVSTGIFRQMNDPVRPIDENTGRRYLFYGATVQRRLVERHARVYVPSDGTCLVADTDRSKQSRQKARLIV